MKKEYTYIVAAAIWGIPAAFTASFYSGLGPMLVFSAIRFLLNLKNKQHFPEQFRNSLMDRIST